MNNLIKIDIAKQIGLFFLLAFPAYGFGRALFESEIGKEQYLGTALIIINSAMVICIGVWLRQTLRQYNERTGSIYFLTRLFEAIALASLTLDLLPTINMSKRPGVFSCYDGSRAWKRSNVYPTLQIYNSTKVVGHLGHSRLCHDGLWFLHGAVW